MGGVGSKRSRGLEAITAVVTLIVDGDRDSENKERTRTRLEGSVFAGLFVVCAVDGWVALVCCCVYGFLFNSSIIKTKKEGQQKGPTH